MFRRRLPCLLLTIASLSACEGKERNLVVRPGEADGSVSGARPASEPPGERDGASTHTSNESGSKDAGQSSSAVADAASGSPVAEDASGASNPDAETTVSTADATDASPPLNTAAQSAAPSLSVPPEPTNVPPDASTAPAEQGIFRVGYTVFHDSASGENNASGSTYDAQFDLPTGVQPGDLLLVFFGADHFLDNLSPAELTPLGWTLLDQHSEYGTDGQGAYLLYKFATENEAAPIVFRDVNPLLAGVQGLLSVYRGVDPVEPIHAYETQLTRTGETGVSHIVTDTPAFTTTLPGCLAIAGLSPDSAIDAPVVTAWPEGFTDNQTSVMNPPHPYPNGWANIYTAERYLAAAGAVGSSTFEWEPSFGVDRYFGAFTFLLALAPR